MSYGKLAPNLLLMLFLFFSNVYKTFMLLDKNIIFFNHFTMVLLITLFTLSPHVSL